MDVVRIHRLELDCIVGIRPQEREHRQRVRLDIGLHADLSQAGRSGRISLTADYDQVAHEVAALLGFRHYHLVEMAAEEVSAMLLGLHSGVERVDLRIEKPGALEGRARAASVEVRRTRRDYPVSVLASEHGAEVLLETREARLDLLRLEPGQSVCTAPSYAARSLEWVVEGTLDAEPGRGAGPSQRLVPSLPAGIIHSSSETPTRFQNPAPESACLFRCWKRTP
ncbi:MAG TPA: dihydroneopterin aldolase [Polyangiaceae bacterium]|nr:dihydroneopterin aldolase [Polyangiaceae bacterium]